MLNVKRAALAAATLLIAACSGDTGKVLGPSEGPAPDISDAAHAGAVPGFYFLPPMVPSPTFSGSFDPALSPVVEICVVSGTSCGATLATYTTSSGAGSEVVRVSTADQLYAVNWRTDLFNLDPAKTYRISVFVGTTRLGFADVDVVSSGRELKNVNTQQFIPLVDDRTLPIKFRIETGIVGQVVVAPAADTVNAGETAQFTATLLDLHGNAVSGPTVSWSSSDPAVATITSGGLATGVAPGTVTITASLGYVSGTASLTVVQPNHPPVSADDSFDAIGNLTVPVPAPGVLANDTDPDGNALTATPGTITTANGGTVTMNADGSFTYLSAPGFTGSDSFTYTATDGIATSTSTVTVAVPTRVWYVSNAGTAPGDGRDTSPFATLKGAESASAAGETIFLLAGDGSTSGYDQGIVLKAGQSLTGQGISSNLTVTLNGQSVVLLAAGSAPTITRASAGATVELAANNTVQGVQVASSNGAGIAGSGFGTFTAGALSLAAQGGPALDLANGTVAASFGNVSSSNSAGAGLDLSGLSGTLTATGGSVSGAAGTGVSVSGGSADVSYAGDVGGSGTRAVSVTGRTGGTVTLSGSISDASGGILVQNNTGGTVAFTGSAKALSTSTSTAVTLASNGGASVLFAGGGLSIATTTGTGFLATGGGTVTVTGANNAIGTTSGTALRVENTDVGASGLTFRSISASNGANGIVLVNTGAQGGVQVTGTGSAGSGGTIQSTSGDGVRLSSTRNTSLSWMNFSGIASAVSNMATCNANNASGCESAIDLSGATDVTLDHININGAGQAGITAYQSSGLTVTNSQILNVGDNDGESGMILHNLSGTSLIQDVTVDNPEEFGITLFNTTGTGGLTLRRVKVQNNVGTWGEAGFRTEVLGGTVVALVDDSDFLNTDGTGVLGAASATGVLNMTVQASRMSGNLALPSGINFTTKGSAVGRLTATGNRIAGCPGANTCSMGIDVDAASTSTLDATIQGNVISDAGIGTGIEFVSNENAVGRAKITGNTVTVRADRIGFNFQSRSVGSTQSGSLDLTLGSNTINGITSAAAVIGGMSFQVGSAGTVTHNNSMCVNLATAHSAGSNTVNGTNNPPLVFAYLVRQRTGTTFKFQGYTGASSTTDVKSFITANNPGGTMGGSAEVFAASGSGGGATIVNYTSGTCATPSATPTP